MQQANALEEGNSVTKTDVTSGVIKANKQAGSVAKTDNILMETKAA